MSGHNKWSKIKRKKGVADVKRSNLFSKLARVITVAAKSGKNLDLAVDAAKKANMPKDNIQRAIDKGTGKLEGEDIISEHYEAYGPEGVGIIIDILTDNKNRALAEIKSTLAKFGGSLAKQGSVSYLFDEQGIIELAKSDQTLSGEDLEMVIIESGAKDYESEDEVFYVYTSSKELENVKKALEFKSLKIDNAKLEMSPKNYVNIPDDKKLQIIKLLETLEDLEDVQSISTNANL